VVVSMMVVVVDGVVVVMVELVVVAAQVAQHWDRWSATEQSRPVNEVHHVA